MQSEETIITQEHMEQLILSWLARRSLTEDELTFLSAQEHVIKMCQASQELLLLDQIKIWKRPSDGEWMMQNK